MADPIEHGFAELSNEQLDGITDDDSTGGEAFILDSIQETSDRRIEKTKTYPTAYDTAERRKLHEEGIFERICALVDVVPPLVRYKLESYFTSAWSKAANVASFFGKTLWILTTASLVTALPVMLDLEREQLLVQQEIQEQNQEAQSKQILDMTKAE